MTTEEQQTILRRLELLRAMTTSRGCSPGEADVAALKIGQAIQHYGVILSFTPPPPPDQRPPSGFDWVGEEVTLAGMTAKAMRFTTGARQYGAETFWVPKSQLRGECINWTIGDSGPLHVTRWWAEKEGWESA